MQRLLQIILLICTTCNAFSQYRLATNFTTKEGLPSKWVYICIEDEKGFLWIATDQGVARFDGIRFQVFTTAQGLPDNDVYLLLKEKNGRLWVKGNNGKFAYFDKIKNRFINSNEDMALKSLKHRALTTPYTLPDGGIYFPNYDSSFLYRNEKWTKYPEVMQKVRTMIVAFNQDSSEIRLGIDSNLFRLYHTKGNQILGSLELFKNNLNNAFYVDRGNVYIVNNKTNKVLIVSNITSKPLRYKIDTLLLSSNYFWHNFTGKYIMMLYENGRIDVFDKKFLKLNFSFNCETLPFNAYNDQKENFWVSSKDKGIFMYQKRKISEYELAQVYKNLRYMCLARNSSGTLFVGSNSGEIIACQDGKCINHKRMNARNTDIQRRIILSQHKVFSFGEGGIFVNYSREIKRKRPACKTAYALNDSVILCGFLNGMCKLNTITEEITELNNGAMEVTCFAHLNNDQIYFGSADGLHKYTLSSDHLDSLIYSDPLLKERIVSMTTTPDSMLWIATATNGILVLRDDKVVTHITEASGLGTNNLLSIANGREHQIWVGSSNGISIINCANLKTSIQNLSVNDGLTSNIVNHLLFQHDTMYAATENGISVIPANISIPRFNIPIELTGIRINNTDTILTDHYKLKVHENSIDLEFSGIELSGHFKNAQMSKDEGLSWSDIGGYHSNLQFESGEHPVWLRAVDVNGNIGTSVLKLQFDIATPFYEEWWFALSMMLLILGASIYSNTIFTKRKQQRKIDQLLNQQALDELEIQALKAQINPHFVFNCLNSIRGFIIDEDFGNADTYLQKFAQLLRSTLDFSSKPSISLKAEFNYIQNYLELEKLRFGDKFVYSLEVEEGMPLQEITIPAMLLQPFVENAINHGVGNLRGKGIVLIALYVKDQLLHIVIDDNGVGREKANEIKQQRSKTHESKGTQLTQRRIDLYHISIDTIDKKNADGSAAGTTIHLKIPIPLQ